MLFPELKLNYKYHSTIRIILGTMIGHPLAQRAQSKEKQETAVMNLGRDSIVPIRKQRSKLEEGNRY